jgi:hypothetical protein
LEIIENGVHSAFYTCIKSGLENQAVPLKDYWYFPEQFEQHRNLNFASTTHSPSEKMARTQLIDSTQYGTWYGTVSILSMISLVTTVPNGSQVQAQVEVS